MKRERSRSRIREILRVLGSTWAGWDFLLQVVFIVILVLVGIATLL